MTGIKCGPEREMTAGEESSMLEGDDMNSLEEAIVKNALEEGRILIAIGTDGRVLDMQNVTDLEHLRNSVILKNGGEGILNGLFAESFDSYQLARRHGRNWREHYVEEIEMAPDPLEAIYLDATVRLAELRGGEKE